MAIVVSVALPACINENVVNDEEPWSLAEGDKCPDFQVTMNDGRVVTTSSLKKTTSMIVFFNTTCSDCRAELPVIQLVSDTLKAQNAPVEILCISRNQSDESVASYWAENHLTLPYSAQETNDVYRLFATSTIPRIYIIGPDLKITATFADSPLPTAQQLLKAVAQ